MKQLLHKLIREDNFLSLAGNLVIALLGVGGFAILARSLGKEDFGQWVLFVAAASLVEMIRFGITSNGLIRFLSGAKAGERRSLVGANVLIGLGTSLAFAGFILLIGSLFAATITSSGFALFFSYYPLLIIANLPWNNAISILQSKLDFGKILMIRSISSGLFFSCLLVHQFVYSMDLGQIAWCLIGVNALTSLISLIGGWDGSRMVVHTTVDSVKTLLNFGKYTTFTLIGTNLLRNADTFLISLSPLGSAAVALYSIPMKLTEMQQIPLRSFAATAFPKMSRASVTGDVRGLKQTFYTYSGALSLLFAAGSLLTFVFADLLVLLLSGEQYVGTDPITGFSAANILRVFSVYGLLLPIDRMTGIALDSINKPRINAIKVLVMVSLNIIGDLIAIFVFESLMLVAVATVVFTLAGILLGMHFLKREMKLSYRNILTAGLAFYKEGWEQLRLKLAKRQVEAVNSKWS
jgi:O-antigen/teichoic acid export membrane protein